jgi:glycosyltransferase involved in cell wall biosynthesis
MILSIAIPTYNRSQHLEGLVRDLLEAIEAAASAAEVVIIDNASTDATMQILQAAQSAHPGRCRVITRTSNVGMEANIAAAALSGLGKYTWLLSDHQTIDKENFKSFLLKLENLDFDFGYARLGQWGAILPVHGGRIWQTLSAGEQGAFLFTVGNMSAFLFKTAHAQNSASSIYRACYFGYPHLGVLSALKKSSVVIETDVLSYLPASLKKIKHAYDVIPTRYRKNLECVKFVLQGGEVRLATRYFFTRDYDRAVRADSLNLLLVDQAEREKALRSLLYVAPANRGLNFAVISWCILFLIVLPTRARVAIADKLKTRFKSVVLKG